LNDEHPHDGDGGELPPWLRDDSPPKAEKPAASTGSQLPAFPGRPEPQLSPEEEAIPPWLRDDKLQKVARFGEDDWLAAADTLPQSLDTEQTYDDWAAIQKELQREKSIEEEVPDLSTPPEELSAAPKQTGPLGKTGELPDWFLGLEELDTSDAPDWFTGESPSAFLSEPEDELPPSQEPAVRTDSISSFFESLHEAPVYDEPDPNNPFTMSHAPADAEDEELPGLDWISSQPYAPQLSPDDSYSGTEMDAFFRSLTTSTARVVTGELKLPEEQKFDEPPQEGTQPIETVELGEQPAEELPDVDWFSVASAASSFDDVEEPELDLIMSDSSTAADQLPETQLDFEEPAEESEAAPVSGETLEWLSELENIVTSVNRPLDDEEPLPATPDLSTLEAFNFASESEVSDQFAEAPVYDWESAAAAAIPDPEEAPEDEIIINPEGVADIKTDWLRAINPEAIEAAQAAAETLPDADEEPAWESPLPPVEPKIKLTGMLTRAGIHEAPEEIDSDEWPAAPESDFFGDLSWDEVVNTPSAADQIPEPSGFSEDTLDSVLLAESLMGVEADAGFETTDAWPGESAAEWDETESPAAPDLDWLGSIQPEQGEAAAEFLEPEAAPTEAEPDSGELDWLATMQAEGNLTVDTPALAEEANADLAAFERALFGGSSQPDYAAGEEETGWMSDALFGDSETAAEIPEPSLESLGLQEFELSEPEEQLTVDQNAASEFERELAELDPSELESDEAPDFFADLPADEEQAAFEAEPFGAAAEAVPEFDLDLSGIIEGEPAGESGALATDEAAAEVEFQYGLESDEAPDFFASGIANEIEAGDAGFEMPASAADILNAPQDDFALEDLAAESLADDAFSWEQPDGEFAIDGEAPALDEEPEAISVPDFIEHESALSEEDDDDRIDDEQPYPEIEAFAAEEAGGFEQELAATEEAISGDNLIPEGLADAAALGVAAAAIDDSGMPEPEALDSENGDGFVIHFGGDAFAYASAEEGLESDFSPTLEQLENGEAAFTGESSSEDDFFRDFGMTQDEAAAEASDEPLPYNEGIPGSFSWEVGVLDAQSSQYEDLDAPLGEPLPEPDPDFVTDLDEQGWVAEAPENVGDEAQYEDLDSYLKTLTISTGTLKPLTDSLLEPDADLESLLEQKVTEDAPAPEGYNPYGTASPFDVSDDPELAELAAAETPEWLSDVSVGEVSATAIVRKQQDRSEGDLDERLKKLRTRAEKIPQQVAATETDSLETVLPGVGSAIAPARIGMSSSGVGDVTLTPDQQGKLALLTSLVAAATDTPAQGGSKQPSAIDQTYESSYNLDFEDEQAPPAAKSPAKAAGKKRKAKSRSRIRVDRLLIALLLLAVISLPFFLREARVGSPPPETFAGDSRAMAAFNTIENLTPGAIVLVGAEYAPASAAELDMALDALLRHILMRGAYPVVISANPLGLLRAELLLDEISHDSDFLAEIGASALQPNSDYFLVQYLPGGAIGLRAFSEDTARLVQNDIRGQVTGLNLTTLLDFSAVAIVSDRVDDVRAYIEQIAPLTQSPVIALVNYGAAPMVEPYVDELPDGMLAGLISGYEGAYAYNTLIGNFPDPQAGLAALLMPEITTEAEAPDAAEGTPPPTPAAQIVPRETRPAPLLFTPSATFTYTSTFTVTPTFTPTPTNTLTPTLTPTPVLGRITSSQAVNLREQPDTTANILALLQPGAAVTVIGQNEDGTWLNVRIDGGVEGWVSSSLIAITGAYSPIDKEIVAKPAEQTRPDETTPTAEFDADELTGTAQISSFVLTATAFAQLNTTSEPSAETATNTVPPTRRATNTPEPTETNTRRPTRTPEPTETNTRRPTATPEPTEAPTEEVTPEATEQAALPLAVTIAPPSAGYRDERWYAMTLGILVSAGVIALGAIINTVRSITRRRRSR